MIWAGILNTCLLFCFVFVNEVVWRQTRSYDAKIIWTFKKYLPHKTWDFDLKNSYGGREIAFCQVGHFFWATLYYCRCNGAPCDELTCTCTCICIFHQTKGEGTTRPTLWKPLLYVMKMCMCIFLSLTVALRILLTPLQLLHQENGVFQNLNL